ncbi:DUF4233 domain-containing protein [Phycicoccus sp. CMS6Z-2]|nr:DUF4233 domain-containing protein [Phycicoccus flavus]
MPLVGRQGRLTFRLLAVVLVGQAIVLVFFALVARGFAVAEGRDAEATRLLWLGLGLAALSVVGAGLMRSPVGVTVGWVVQALTWASAVLVHSMVAVALIFSALWVFLFVKGRQADALVARHAAEAAAGDAAPGSGAPGH